LLSNVVATPLKSISSWPFKTVLVNVVMTPCSNARRGDDVVIAQDLLALDVHVEQPLADGIPLVSAL